MSSPCCPPGSTLSMSAAQAGATGPTTGEEIKLDDVTRAYVARPKPGEPVKGAVVIFHDIFGYDSGRTHHVADEMASWGYIVLAPEFFGKELEGISEPEHIFSIWTPWRLFTGGGSMLVKRARAPFSAVQAKIENLIMPWLNENAKGVKVGILGFCWGGWAITRAASLPYFSCAVGAHPSPDVQYLQSEGPSTAQMYEQVKVPMLYMPGSNDPFWLKEGGSSFNAILRVSPQSRCVSFNDVIHGWVIRGDIRNETVRKAYEKAMHEMKTFYDLHLPSKM